MMYGSPRAKLDARVLHTGRFASTAFRQNGWADVF